MRAPSFVRDGWCLEDGEQRHREAPATFLIPDLALREALEPGDIVQLIFRIAVDGEEHGAVERMWVIIRERVPGGYVGMLDNDPNSVAENDVFWHGTELPFEYRHIIAVMRGDEASTALAKAPVPIPWNRGN
jgi:hypothetical protein